MAKIGRNEPCPCGSGKKYKKCCLGKIDDIRAATKNTVVNQSFMDHGYALTEKNLATAACDAWWRFWEEFKTRVDTGIRDINLADGVKFGQEPVFNWCQDFEMELGNAGYLDTAYHRMRISYCDEFCEMFPASDTLLLHNMKRAAAESSFAVGDIADGEDRFDRLLAEYPDNVWGYIGWGDMYHWPKFSNAEPDFERAEQIYRMALGKGLEDEDEVAMRLEQLQKDKAKRAEKR